MFDNFAKFVIENGGSIHPLIIPSELTNGTGIMNPSIFVDGEKIVLILRHVNYSLYHSELDKYEHQWGPLVYLHPEDDLHLRTFNYYCELDSNFNIIRWNQIDTSKFPEAELWQLVGLEDARVFRWNDKLYTSGVRRDLDIIGTGRMELCEIEVYGDSVVEVNRFRLPAPNNSDSYCEKNWMPILDIPYHYVKWSNPTEIVKCIIDNPSEIKCESVFLGNSEILNYDLRGGSQVIQYKDGYLALNHVTYLYDSKAKRKNATYRHQFTYWDGNWNPIKRSAIFDFMGAKIEFSCGMTKYKNDYLITFGFQDNSAYLLRIPEELLDQFIFN
jgi:hypothetical protein